MSLSYDQQNKIAGAGVGENLDICFQGQTAPPVVFAVELDSLSTEILLSPAISSQIRCGIFQNRAALVDGMSRNTPDLIFLNVTPEGTNAIEVLHALSQCAYPGILQLMSQRGVSMIEPIRQLAQLHSLQVLPPLIQPIGEPTLKSVLSYLGSGISKIEMPQIRLDDAINNGWVQFWYQPKIDLRTKTLVGIEAFVRLFHPNKGLLSPASVLKNADERSMIALLHHALAETGVASAKLSEMGLKLTITINAPLKALQTLPITPIFRDYVARTGHQRNWIFDVSEEDIVKSRSDIKNIGAVFRSVGIKLAIDNFSGRILTRSDLKELPVSEIKLRPKFVTNCDSKLDHSEVCKGLIDLAHNFQCTAVAIGVETTEQCLALQRMGCDVGQGFLFGHPLPLEQFIGMVRRRSISACVRAPGLRDANQQRLLNEQWQQEQSN